MPTFAHRAKQQHQRLRPVGPRYTRPACSAHSKPLNVEGRQQPQDRGAGWRRSTTRPSACSDTVDGMDLRGVDVDGVRSELERFVSEAEPRTASGGGVLTSRSLPACGRARALELSERVRPILDRLCPAWRDENAPSKNFEFRAERDASSRLLARIASRAEINGLFIEHDDAPKLSASQLHSLVWRAASAQWSTGHRHEAVLAAAKAVNSQLQRKLERRDLSEAKLVREAFSEKPAEPGRPRLRVTGVQDHQTQESLRQGVMAFWRRLFSGDPQSCRASSERRARAR